jgi:hypothetical protein
MEHPPTDLLETQTWFGKVIAQDPGVALIDAEKYIVPNALLSSAERIAIYKKGYWERLLNILRETFPALHYILGTQKFDDQIVIPYLSENIPEHWSLSQLGNTLPKWIKNHGFTANYYELAEIDYAYRASFSAKELPEFDPARLMDIPDKVLILQPHITLIHHQYDYTQFREQLFDQAPEYWQEHPLPTLIPQPFYGMIWRDYQHNVGCLQLDPFEHAILQKFAHGISLEHLCAWLETQSQTVRVKAQEYLQSWMHKWIINAWLCIHIQKESK